MYSEKLEGLIASLAEEAIASRTSWEHIREFLWDELITQALKRANNNWDKVPKILGVGEQKVKLWRSRNDIRT